MQYFILTLSTLPYTTPLILLSLFELALLFRTPSHELSDHPVGNPVRRSLRFRAPRLKKQVESICPHVDSFGYKFRNALIYVRL